MLTKGKSKISICVTGSSFGTFVIDLMESITKYTSQKRMLICRINIVKETASL